MMVKKRRRQTPKKFIPQASIVSDEIYLPNHSGEHTAGTTGTPVGDRDIANKKYVDDTHVPAGSEGEIQFNESSAFQADSNLFWDNVNKRLGIGVADPHSKLEVNGAISSTTLTITASADNTDVSGVNTMFIDTSSGDVVVGGFTGGVAGQFLYVALSDYTNDVTLEHAEGVGDQDIIMHQATDETLTSEPGGWTLICDGSDWYDCSHAKHV